MLTEACCSHGAFTAACWGQGKEDGDKGPTFGEELNLYFFSHFFLSSSKNLQLYSLFGCLFLSMTFIFYFWSDARKITFSQGNWVIARHVLVKVLVTEGSWTPQLCSRHSRASIRSSRPPSELNAELLLHSVMRLWPPRCHMRDVPSKTPTQF